MQNNSWSLRKFIQFLAFLLLFVAIPGGTWYYLKSGRDNQRAARAELKNYGKIPAFGFQSQDGQPVSEADLKHRLAVIQFLPSAELADVKIALMEQFEDRDDVIFLSVAPDSTAVLKKLFAEKFPRGRKNWHLASETTAEFRLFFEKAAHENGFQIPAENLIALADTSSTIRRFYNGGDRGEMVKLVHHLGLILPVK